MCVNQSNNWAYLLMKYTATVSSNRLNFGNIEVLGGKAADSGPTQKPPHTQLDN
jgi:hypothetical protein